MVEAGFVGGVSNWSKLAWSSHLITMATHASCKVQKISANQINCYYSDWPSGLPNLIKMMATALPSNSTPARSLTMWPAHSIGCSLREHIAAGFYSFQKSV